VSNWYQLAAQIVIQQQNSDAHQGLTAAEAQARLLRDGPNELIEAGRKPLWKLFWEQLSAPLVVILIVAAVLSYAVGDAKDAIAIMAIVIFNAVLGVRQEYKAEEAMAALKQMSVPTVRVRRDGQVQEVSAQNLVKGDVILLEAGNLVPADGRLIETVNLQIQEAALTGESEAVEKDAGLVFETEEPLADRRNMIYRGTLVSRGRGMAVLTATGMDTELGHIARLIQTVEVDQTPLQKRLDQLGRVLGLVAVVIAAIIALLGLIQGASLREMLLTGVSVAVAAVPEGLPAVVTIALALGAERMLKRKALIRNLPAVETLGSVTTICSDKTGTLTENRMTVTQVELPQAPTAPEMGPGSNSDNDTGNDTGNNAPSDVYNLESLNLQILQGGDLDLTRHPALTLLLLTGSLCNDATLDTASDTTPDVVAIGDPTETALVVAAAKLGLTKPTLEASFPRIAEVPFDSDRKCMTTFHQLSASSDLSPALASLWSQVAGQGQPTGLSFCKGAVHRVLGIATGIWLGDRVAPLTTAAREALLKAHDRLAEDGLRVLALGFRSWSQPPTDYQEATLEQGLVFVGFTGLIDPARSAVQGAIHTCQTAGIRVVMITGDHPLTAHHIAKDLGIITQGNLLTGQQLSQMTTQGLTNQVEDLDVYARVSPEDKLTIVQALQSRGHIVAMTGDGVNDAPALKKADIGVAMGITGTDVAKEAADIVLQDDNFATIVAAVREGRVIYDNIRKFIKYVLMGNAGQLWLLFLAPFLGMPLPLKPLQILWINLIADGILALALSFEPAESRVMARSPYKPNESVFGRGVGRDILWIGLLFGLVLLGMAYGYRPTETGSEEIVLTTTLRYQTMVFSTLAFSRIALVEAVRSNRDSLFKIGIFSNPQLLGAVVLTLGLQFAIIYIPSLQDFFGTTTLSGMDLAIALGLSTIGFWTLEVQKLWLRRF
jgi:Ca2+-transporting ATPase